MTPSELAFDQEHQLDPDMHPFQLDPRLKGDCFHLGKLQLCDLLLMNDANYPWFILVPRRSGVSEIYHLSEADQYQLTRESSFLAQNLSDIFAADKMNVAALGNVVSQLHVHHVVRFQTDSAWPKPVWGVHPAMPYSDQQIVELKSRIQAMLEDWVQFDSEQ